MIILAQRDDEGYQIFKALYVSYDENLYDCDESSTEKLTEGLYLELQECESCCVENLTKKDCNSLIKDLYRYGKLDLTKYTIRFFDEE
ncbi:hypothetical protein [Clostridium cochlearium]|uniref:hypothetical protein n=1 Tax=Clostridium cochlearium TaxID=1494 RepID=UPI00241D50D4|nr:hypothetical protein [Clostridium cochlearium]MBE6065902.1 hypothetical protein [Clostridium cochlearium]